MDSLSEMKLAQVHPELAKRVRIFADKCSANGTVVHVTCGLRTYEEQNELYEQGRSNPGNVVTNAQAGHSAHQFGYAVDIVPGVEDSLGHFTPDWDGMDPRWKMVLQMAKTCGLAEGAEWRTFPDRPHLYLEECPASPDQTMRDTFAASGMDGVWQSLGIKETV